MSKQFQPGWCIVPSSRMLSRFLGNHDNQLCCILRLNDDQGNQGHWTQDQSVSLFHLLDGQPPGCHSSLSSSPHTRLGQPRPWHCHLKCYCATGAYRPYCIHEVSLTIASGVASLLEQRIVGMVPSAGGKLKGAVYPILKMCCYFERRIRSMLRPLKYFKVYPAGYIPWKWDMWDIEVTHALVRSFKRRRWRC